MKKVLLVMCVTAIVAWGVGIGNAGLIGSSSGKNSWSQLEKQSDWSSAPKKFNKNSNKDSKRSYGASFGATPPDGSPVPEPATMLLLGTGLIGLGVLGLRKRRKSQNRIAGE